MRVFFLVLTQMLMMALLILVGYVLRKKKIVPENTGIVLSKLETFVFVPALNVINQLNYCTIENLKKTSILILYGFILILVAIGIAYPVSRLFVPKADGDSALMYQRNIYKYAITFGNYGFMGNFIVLGIWGDEMLFKYTMFTFVVTIFCNVWGLYILIPKENSVSIGENLKKGLLAPPIIAIAVGIVCGLLNLKSYFPDFVLTAFDNASKCMGPCAMLLAGIIIGGYDLKKLFSNIKVYIITFLRLIVIPCVFICVLKFFGINKEILTLTIIAFATPLGMNTIVFPAAYGGDTKTGASMTVISNILSIITIPLMYYVFIV